MTLEKIPEGDYREQAIAEKVNEIVEYINSIQAQFGSVSELLGVSGVDVE